MCNACGRWAVVRCRRFLAFWLLTVVSGFSPPEQRLSCASIPSSPQATTSYYKHAATNSWAAFVHV
ncbi:hypothetical protein PF011_g18453 [Phytophthora fragariae]|uniref:Secreted protein n=1 Tax=Phytophthora fragariae TaxID=53985 RepID=A0A6A3J6Y0_9STRA|nr:hypothetical protein PF011_g18453 [Phytophthora fragariae]